MCDTIVRVAEAITFFCGSQQLCWCISADVNRPDARRLSHCKGFDGFYGPK